MAEETKRQTPEEWMLELGNVLQFQDRTGNPTHRPLRGAPKRERGEGPLPNAEHAAASALHGWADDAYHTAGTPDRLQLTKGDYEAALAAAAELDVDGSPVPHVAALSKAIRNYEARVKDAQARKAARAQREAEAAAAQEAHLAARAAALKITVDQYKARRAGEQGQIPEPPPAPAPTKAKPSTTKPSTAATQE